jgi:hypothetical protein
MDTVMDVLSNNQAIIIEQIRALQPQLDALKRTNEYLFSAYHQVRTLGDVGREEQWSEEKMIELLEDSAKHDPYILSAKLAVEGRV